METDTSKSEDLKTVRWEKLKGFSLHTNGKALLSRKSFRAGKARWAEVAERWNCTSELLPKGPALTVTLTTLGPRSGVCFSLTSTIDSPGEVRFSLDSGDELGSWASHKMHHPAYSLPFQLEPSAWPRFQCSRVLCLQTTGPRKFCVMDFDF